jgi:hypothetical protein
MIRVHASAREISCVTAPGVPGIEIRSRAPQGIPLALPRFVKLSYFGMCEFDVSLGPDGGRKIFQKVRSSDNLRAWEQAGAQIGDLASPCGVSSGTPAWPALKARKIDTTDLPLVAAELERKPATISA